MRPERPVAVDREQRVQRHRYQTNREVCDRKREEEIVAYRLQLLVDLEADHDHGVADDSGEREAGGDDEDDSLLCDAVGACGEVGAERQVGEVGVVGRV